VQALPEGHHAQEQEAVAETIENNVRKLIIDESPVNPKYYEKMSALLDALIAQRRKGACTWASIPPMAGYGWRHHWSLVTKPCGWR
jgi:type I restriction enzyme R subunit